MSSLGLQMSYFRSLTTELWPLINVRIRFALNIWWMNLWISIRFCICIDIVKFWDHKTFSLFFDELWPLIDVTILFLFSILGIDRYNLVNFCACIDIDNIWIYMVTYYFSLVFNRVMVIDWLWKFVYAQFSCELIDGSWLNFVYTLVLSKSRKEPSHKKN